MKHPSSHELAAPRAKKGCRTAILVGGRERESGIAIVKDLVERSQREVLLADLPLVLKGETP